MLIFERDTCDSDFSAVIQGVQEKNSSVKVLKLEGKQFIQKGERTEKKILTKKKYLLAKLAQDPGK